MGIHICFLKVIMSSSYQTNIPHNHADNFAKLKCPISTIICREKTIIIGDVTIGPDCVIHPTAHIIAKHGPIVIGSGNLIEERVEIINNKPTALLIGDNNLFEVDSRCEASRIGNNNILECKSFIGPNCELTNNCIIGAGCRLKDPAGHSVESQVEIFQPNTIITGSNLNRRVATSSPATSHTSQLDFLRKVLPNYQKLWRPSNLPATPPTFQK